MLADVSKTSERGGRQAVSPEPGADNLGIRVFFVLRLVGSLFAVLSLGFGYAGFRCSVSGERASVCWVGGYVERGRAEKKTLQSLSSEGRFVDSGTLAWSLSSSRQRRVCWRAFFSFLRGRGSGTAGHVLAVFEVAGVYEHVAISIPDPCRPQLWRQRQQLVFSSGGFLSLGERNRTRSFVRVCNGWCRKQ